MSFKAAIEAEVVLTVTASKLITALLRHTGWDLHADSATTGITLCDRSVVLSYGVGGIGIIDWQVSVSGSWCITATGRDPNLLGISGMVDRPQEITSASLVGDRNQFERDAVLVILTQPEPEEGS